jgi:hypothetical protein
MHDHAARCARVESQYHHKRILFLRMRTYLQEIVDRMLRDLHSTRTHTARGAALFIFGNQRAWQPGNEDSARLKSSVQCGPGRRAMRGIVQRLNYTFEMYGMVNRVRLRTQGFDGMVPRCLEDFGIKKIGELTCRQLLPTYIISTDQSAYHMELLVYSGSELWNTIVLQAETMDLYVATQS